MFRPAPLGGREYAVAACSVDLVRSVVQAGMAPWLRPPSNRTKLRPSIHATQARFSTE